ncbi:hypothetical protein V495_01317 [Pseudogymnoascus sp. VKM F-4514 (FW-929)]|nr:hypothetical protein V495_01317 [Pseudogymnoascus sp. VKM F-4514 (FW-929)]KFY59243.1 hypothetical protein V497_04467 [Pseudogymnoascus sp. VKM F-4516 (FW-969)]
MSVVQTALRALQFLWILLLTALIGNVLAGKTSDNSTVNYAMFTIVFCWLVWIYGMAAAFVESVAFPIVLLVLDALATLFTFVAGVVLAKKLGAHSCNNRGYLETRPILRDNGSTTKHCRELQASCAFFWFLFACFIGSMVMTGLKGGFGGMKRGGGSGPAMSQVR